MATLAQAPAPAADDKGFFLTSALAMTAVMVAGFSLQLAMGRSSFRAPPLVHAHALVFFAWVFLYLAQNFFIASGRVALHRTLGWIGALWVVLMVSLGIPVTLALVQAGRVPFFFTPLQFLALDPGTLLGFAALAYAAIALRRRSDWHRRLHFCAMTLLLGPGLGRLLPMPLFQPWAFEISYAVTLLFPLAGMAADLRRERRVHPAWYWGGGALLIVFALIELVTFSPLGLALYAAATAGTPGAAVPPLAFAPPPSAP